jgi:hypothetical protein
MRKNSIHIGLALAALGLVVVAMPSCGGDDLYQGCGEPADCEVPEGKTAVCLAKSGGGFCTWQCGVDPDCVGGKTELLCASFESTEGKYCFPPCEGTEEACPDGFTCRSTGGGTENRKICFPNE